VALLEGDYWLEKVCEHWDYLERREEKRRERGEKSIGIKTLGDSKPKWSPSHKVSEGHMKPFLTSLHGIKSQRRLPEETRKIIVISFTGLTEAKKRHFRRWVCAFSSHLYHYHPTIP